jgi:hypothetical protein
VDQQDVDLWEAVRAATGGPDRRIRAPQTMLSLN